MSAPPSQLATTFPGARSWLAVSAVLLSAALARPSQHRHAHRASEARACSGQTSPVVKAFRAYRAWTDTHSTMAFEKRLADQCSRLGRAAPPLRAFDQLRPDRIIDIRCNHVLAGDTSLTWDGALWLPKPMK
jgi:hypothetical protein